MRCVGILGGMGPGATVLMMQRLVAAVPAADDADHIPLIVDQNPQVPSRIAHLIEGTGPDPAPVLAAMAQRLAAAGAEALAMPCVTGHHYAPAIRAAAAVPFLDMVALSVARATDLARIAGEVEGAAVGILASPAVRRVGLFEAPLAKAGLVPLYPRDPAALLAAIRRIKAEGPSAGAGAALRAASEDLLSQGARVQMIACTELSLVAGGAKGAAWFDTLDVLVEAVRDFALEAGTPEVAGRQGAVH